MHDDGAAPDNPGYSGAYSSASSGGYTATVYEQYQSRSSSNYYPTSQPGTSYYPQQSQSYSTHYASSSAGYDSSYYALTSATTAGGELYDAGADGYYAGNGQPAWTANADPRAFVGTGTTYEGMTDLAGDSSRRNAELYHYCEHDRHNA